MSCITYFAELVFGIFISPFIWPLVLVISLLNWTVRFCLSTLVFPGRYEFPSNSFDCLFFHPSWVSSTVLFAFYSPDPVNIDHERGMWAAILRHKQEDGSFTYEKLKKRFVKKYGYVVLEKMLDNEKALDVEAGNDSRCFNINEHVKVYSEIKPRNEEFLTEEEFHHQILPSLLEPLDNSKPQWEYLVFPRVRRNNENIQSVRVFRWNHAYMDGASLALFIGEQLFDKKPGQESDFFFHPKEQKSVPPLFTLFAKAWAIFNLPLILIVGAILHIPFVKSKMGTGLFSSKHAVNPKLTLTAPIRLKTKTKDGGRVRIQTNIIPAFLETVKEMFPNTKETGIKCTIPLALTPYPNSKPRNNFVPLEPNFKINSAAKDLKPSKQLGLDFLFTDILIKYFGWLPSFAINNINSGHCSVDLNNAPLFRSKGTINGTMIEKVGAWGALLRPQWLGLCILTYGDESLLTTTSVEGDLTEETARHFSRRFAENLVALTIPIQKRQIG